MNSHSILSNNISSVKAAGNQLFPVFLKLGEMKTVLVGGGNVGLEKLNTLISNAPEADITVVAKEILPDFFQLQQRYPSIKIKQKNYNPVDLADADIVFVASNNTELNRQIRMEADVKNLLVNFADKPKLCDFYLASVIQKGDLKIGISTNGKSPIIAKRLKEVLNQYLPADLDQTLSNMNALRNTLKGDFTYKVKTLNKVTELLVNPNKKKSFLDTNIKWIIWLAGILFIWSVGLKLWNTQPGFQHFLIGIDSKFWWFLGAGFVFAMIDGAIGMSYGVTSTSFSLAMGLSPASASMGIHISEILSNGIAGWMHYRMRNVNWKLFRVIIIPAIIGAILGAYILSSLEHYNAYVKPIVGLYTFVLGAVILKKAIDGKKKKNDSGKKIKKIGFLGFFGGFIDAAFGGGWGSIVLSGLIAGGRHPLFSLGTVKISRFFIAALSSLTFFTMLGGKYWEAVLGLVIGSVLASPIAAKASNKMSAKTIMIAVGIIVMMASTNSVVKFILKLV